MNPHWAVFAIGITLGGSASAAVWFAEAPRLVRLSLGHAEYVVSGPDDPLLAEAVELRASALERSEVLVFAEELSWALAVNELGYSIHREALLKEARDKVETEQKRAAEMPLSLRLSPGRLWSSLTRAPLSTAALIPIELDLETARTKLQKLARQILVEPEDAVLDIKDHRIHKSRIGRRLSLEAGLTRLAQTPLEVGTLFELPMEVLEPEVTEADLAPVDVSRVLATYETSFRGKAGARAVNIQTAARFLDGAVILPGQELSFNSRVGRRIHGRGFVDAPVIVNDEFEKDVGGGVCQVASTLHAAAVFGDLQIVQRRSHSRPSGYAPIGLDATVIDGEVDLKIRNPYDEPLLVHAFLSGPYKIKVEILGREPDVKVEHAASVQNREAFVRRVWFKEEVPAGQFQLKQKGSEGMDVISVVSRRLSDGKVERRSYTSKYYPVPEVFWVGRQVAPGALPPLPEGAKGLFIEGQEVGGAVDQRPAAPTDVPRLADTLDG